MDANSREHARDPDDLSANDRENCESAKNIEGFVVANRAATTGSSDRLLSAEAEYKVGSTCNSAMKLHEENESDEEVKSGQANIQQAG